MQQTTEKDGLLFTYAVHSDPGKSLNNKQERHVHYFHIPKAGDNSEHLLGTAPETRIVSNVSGYDLSAQVLQRYDISLVLLSPDSPLITILRDDPAWRVVIDEDSEDEKEVLLERR